jgi:site-specific DNA-methyltransferase (adenine-specific)
MEMAKEEGKVRAPRNRTITLTDEDRSRLRERIIRITSPDRFQKTASGIILGDYADWVELLPERHFDLLFLDPPYNLDKNFNGKRFSRQTTSSYTKWLDETIQNLKPLLKTTATVYICGDWFTSVSIFEAASKHLVVRNRITWEREKGRGSAKNWKACSEDIWFCTVSESYRFNVDSVKLRRKVMAPYTDNKGYPKDWTRTTQGKYRDTHPSNLWTDITIPFWSMPENTDHPTQKSEKLLAKLILASSNKGDSILDPFLGSGTTAVVAKKLNRSFVGIEIDEEYCLLAAKRLELAEVSNHIQGLTDGVFWERNSLEALHNQQKSGHNNRALHLFTR